jgi:hypothetical protein
MNIIDWNYNDQITIPMIEDEQGNLFVLAKTAQAVLGLSQQHMSALFHRHRDEFELSTTVRVANEFIQQNKDRLLVERARKDMLILTEGDFILFLTLSRTEVGKDMRKQFVQFIKSNAVRTHTGVLEERLAAAQQDAAKSHAVVAQLGAAHAQLAKDFLELKDQLGLGASHAGSQLSYYKKVRSMPN